MNNDNKAALSLFIFARIILTEKGRKTMNEFMTTIDNETQYKESSTVTSSLKDLGQIFCTTLYIFTLLLSMLFILYWHNILPLDESMTTVVHGYLCLSFMSATLLHLQRDLPPPLQPWGKLERSLAWQRAITPGSSLPSSHSRKAPPAAEV